MRKLTHKEISKLPTKDFLRLAKAPYRRLMGYVRPYRTRFILSVVFGVLFGIFNGVMLFGIKMIFETVLPQAGESVSVTVPAGEDKKELGYKITRGGEEKSANIFSKKTKGSPAILIAEGKLPLGKAKAGDKLEVKLPVEKFLTVDLKLWKFEIPKPHLSNDSSLLIVVLLSLVIPVLILIRGLLSYLNKYYLLWVGNRVLFDLRDNLFRSLMNHSIAFYNRQKTGELIQTVFNQTRMAQTAATNLAANLVKHPISILSIVVALVIMNWVFAVCALVVFPLCILPVFFISKKVRSAGGKEEQEAGMLMVRMQEAFAGINVVKSHAREDYELKRFNNADEKMLAFIMRWSKALEIVAPLVETVASLGIAAGLVYAWKVGMPATDFFILYLALIALYPHVKALSQIQIQLQKCAVATSKVFSIMDEQTEVPDALDAAGFSADAVEIKFDNVSFAYAKSSSAALKNFNFKFETGKYYALVGETGAGKSTILSLIMRFFDPYKGSIKFNGTDIREFAQRSLRDHVGVVTQDTFLFHDTIANNIRYGRLDATDEEVIAAAKLAHADEFIAEKPDGYGSMIGDKGAMLSGGQQQRLTIARAILRNAPLLLLDEATSALDSETERNIQEAINTLASGKTVIAIAHRLSTILHADAIIVMDKGMIHAAGTHAELLEKSPLYARLYHLQYEHPQKPGEDDEEVDVGEKTSESL